MTLVLTIWLYSGAIIQEPSTVEQCRDLIGISRFVAATGQHLSRDGAGRVSIISCGGDYVVLSMPASVGPCEAGS